MGSAAHAGGANQGALHGPHLVRAQNYFREFIVAAGEEDEVAHDAQKALRMNELLHQVFEIFAGYSSFQLNRYCCSRLQVAP